jgi:hypothetical protein
MRARVRIIVGLAATLSAVALVYLAPTDAAVGQQQEQPFRGVTTKGTVQPGLFAIRQTGVSTRPVRDAAERFLASLADSQRARTVFAVDDPEWRLWNNVHRYNRQGVSLRALLPSQRDAAFGLLQASLSARGFQQSRDIMRLNGYIAEALNNSAEYGDDLYFFTVMGTPSDTAPWGWQLDGHHLIINYFVLGDQVVMTPTFMGSEPVTVADGKYAGTAVLQAEERKGFALFRSLTPDQRRAAVLETAKTRNNALAQAFQDNLVLDYAGIRASALNSAQRTALLDLVGEYVGAMREGHARVRMDEVRAHLDSTYFAWIGTDDPNGVFYYRIQSPVILIEFDHQTPVAFRVGGSAPTRQHIHTVVRTPNGNDYGKDLLRQHYEAHRNDPAHGHR